MAKNMVIIFLVFALALLNSITTAKEDKKRGTTSLESTGAATSYAQVIQAYPEHNYNSGQSTATYYKTPRANTATNLNNYNYNTDQYYTTNGHQQTIGVTKDTAYTTIKVPAYFIQQPLHQANTHQQYYQIPSGNYEKAIVQPVYITKVPFLFHPLSNQLANYQHPFNNYNSHGSFYQ